MVDVKIAALLYLFAAVVALFYAVHAAAEGYSLLRESEHPEFA